MKVTATELEGVVIVEPRVWRDGRGHFYEAYREAAYLRATGARAFVQDNVSVSHRGVLRGLHLQNPRAQGKLVSVLHGAVWDVAVDVRVGSPTFGRWVGVALSADEPRQLYVPEGFAHGFLVTSDTTVVHYKCTDYYALEDEVTVRWDDPDLAIAWPLDGAPTLSEKDAAAPALAELAGRLPRYGPGAGG